MVRAVASNISKNSGRALCSFVFPATELGHVTQNQCHGSSLGLARQGPAHGPAVDWPWHTTKHPHSPSLTPHPAAKGWERQYEERK